MRSGASLESVGTVLVGELVVFPDLLGFGGDFAFGASRKHGGASPILRIRRERVVGEAVRSGVEGSVSTAGAEDGSYVLAGLEARVAGDVEVAFEVGIAAAFAALELRRAVAVRRTGGAGDGGAVGNVVGFSRDDARAGLQEFGDVVKASLVGFGKVEGLGVRAEISEVGVYQGVEVGSTGGTVDRSHDLTAGFAFTRLGGDERNAYCQHD